MQLRVDHVREGISLTINMAVQQTIINRDVVTTFAIYFLLDTFDKFIFTRESLSQIQEADRYGVIDLDINIILTKCDFGQRWLEHFVQIRSTVVVVVHFGNIRLSLQQQSEYLFGRRGNYRVDRDGLGIEVGNH